MDFGEQWPHREHDEPSGEGGDLGDEYLDDGYPDMDGVTADESDETDPDDNVLPGGLEAETSGDHENDSGSSESDSSKASALRAFLDSHKPPEPGPAVIFFDMKKTQDFGSLADRLGAEPDPEEIHVIKPGEGSDSERGGFGDDEAARVFRGYLQDAIEAAKRDAADPDKSGDEGRSAPNFYIDEASGPLDIHSESTNDSGNIGASRNYWDQHGDPNPPPVPSWSQLNDAIEGLVADTTYEADTRSDLAKFVAEEMRSVAGITEDGAEATEFLGSVAPWDGEQPEVPLPEQKAAGAVVAEAVAAHQQQGLLQVDMLGTTNTRDRRYDPETGKTYQVRTTQVADELVDDVEARQLITVKEAKPDGTGAGAFYEVGRDGVVRRTDIREATEAEREAAAAGNQDLNLLAKPIEEMTEEDAMAVMEFAAKVILNHIGNSDLEETLRLRRQPIGVDEARRLASLLLRRPYEPEDPAGQ